MARKMRDSGVEWIGEVPEGWEVIKNRAFLKNVSVRNHPDATVLSLYRDLGVIPKLSRDDNHNVTGEDTAQYKFVEKGDLVINKMKAWQGSVGLSEYEGIVSPAYYVCRFWAEIINKKYAHYLLRNQKLAQEFEKLSTGMRVGQWDLGIDDFLRVPIPLPPLPEQRRIADYLDEKCAAIDGAVDELKRGIEDCKAWKKAIIFEAVTGKANVLAAKNAKVAKRQMRDSGIPWIGEIPEGWEVRRLKGVLARPLQYGASESGIGYNEALPRYIRITDITLDGKLKGEGALSLTEEAASDYILRDQDILLARSGATVGKAFLYEKQMGRAAFAGYLIRATVDVAKTLPRFVYYTTLGCGYDDWRSSIAVSATIQNIGADKYNNYSLPIPPMKEQQAIADYLDEKCAAIDALVAEKEKLIADLETYKKSLIFELVTGKREVA